MTFGIDAFRIAIVDDLVRLQNAALIIELRVADGRDDVLVLVVDELVRLDDHLVLLLGGSGGGGGLRLGMIGGRRRSRLGERRTGGAKGEQCGKQRRARRRADSPAPFQQVRRAGGPAH